MLWVTTDACIIKGENRVNILCVVFVLLVCTCPCIGGLNFAVGIMIEHL